jgi:hypothetical protein
MVYEGEYTEGTRIEAFTAPPEPVAEEEHH